MLCGTHMGNMETARATSNVHTAYRNLLQPPEIQQRTLSTAVVPRVFDHLHSTCLDCPVHATRRRPGAPGAAARMCNAYPYPCCICASTAYRPCTSGHLCTLMPGRLASPRIAVYHAVGGCAARMLGTLPRSTRRPCFLGLAYDTDLQEQGFSHPRTCCNKGIAKAAATGAPLPGLTL